ncbi:MAG: hypothetical protein EZS28_023972 [Streblomastix strix]|uniref:Uncharacterized protein n=1 Tax=Streblomastix strix TaxID=222440 RepID=A0A5J4VDI9_9EUKA|nr:MAG: hypothetical protein EZS28_023972 [Streblomastix strix]
MMSNEEYQLFIDNNNALVYAANNQIVDGIASDYALKIEPNGLLTIKNLKVINFDFVAQINQSINQENLLQQSIGTIEQDITDIKNDIDTINQELSRQTHFRGYYLLNTDIQNLPNSANGDFSFSADSGTVWMYDADWQNSGDIVPDQVTPASDATPLLSIVSGNVGVSTEYVRGDHQHPLQVSTVLPVKDTAIGEEGTANTYARSDHTHHVNLGNSVPKKDTGTGTSGSANVYSSATHQHPLNIDPTTANVPLVNATAAANGTSDYYCRNDHVHPQQLTYDGNGTATKFIKTGGLASEVLCANGDTTTLDNKLSRSYNSSGGGWIRLCVFPAGASVAPTKVSANYVIDSGVNQLFHTHSGSSSSAIYLAYVRIESTNNITIVVSDQSTYYTNRITEVLTQDVVSSVSSATQIPITYDLGNGGIINNMLQVNPTGCSNSAINTTQAGQWEISKTNDNAITINPSSLRQADHSVGLINLGTDQTITGTKTINNVLKISPTSNDYTEGIRIVRSSNGNCSGIYLGCNPNSTNGTMEGQWNIVNAPDGQLLIGVNTQIGQPNQGLVISTDGQTLSFNGSVIAGAGATNGASNGSVNYSAGNPIL